MSAIGLRIEDGAPDLAAGARSYAYRLFASAFAFPDAALAHDVASGRWLEQLSRLTRLIPYAMPLTPADRAASSDTALTFERMQEDYIALFDVGAGRPYCPLYEGSHRRGRTKIMEELVRFYEHFGLRPAPGDQPDHLCAELEFMHYLAFKEAALASTGGNPSDVILAARDFLSRRLCPWLPKIAAALEAAPAALAFYASLARLTADFCRRDLAWLRSCREISDA